jgi:hypothetical protein
MLGYRDRQVVKNKTHSNCGRERKDREPGTKVSRMYSVERDRHLQMIGSNFAKKHVNNNTVLQVIEVKNKEKVVMNKLMQNKDRQTGI